MSKEERIRKITHIYYSNPKVQEAIFSFSQNREVAPSYMMESFGKRPDSFQYKGDIFELVKKGATSFHCSEEIWNNPLGLSTNLGEKQLNELREGWDLVIDIDSKYLDYSKILAQQIIKFLKFHRIKNTGIKYSGSKGFHIIVPWKAFPKEVNKIKTSDMFPSWPRIILKYIMEQVKEKLIDEISSLSRPSKYIRDYEAPKAVIPDLVLVSPRHLFRMPYSLHEKTALASIPLEFDEIQSFQPKDASPLKVKIKNYLPEAKEEEARELLMQALDWFEGSGEKKEKSEKIFDFKPVKFDNLSEKYFPPSIQKILQGIADGRKRALFVLINFFRSTGMEKEEFEKRIYDWNKKNPVPLKEGYIKSQLSWSYRNKVVPPPSYDKDYYKGIGIVPTEEEMRYKNPLNYLIRKIQPEKNNLKNKDNFKNQN